MHIVVAGASGKTGREVVEQAVSAGHRVTALVRDGSPYEAPSGVEVQRAEVVSDAALMLPADVDAVISTLGMRSDLQHTPVCEPGTANLLAAMEQAGISRIVVVSAVPAFTAGRGEPWWFRIIRALVRRRMPDVYRDIEGMERALRASAPTCRWTILRPGYLVEGVRTEYRLLAERNATTNAHRSDVAHALLALAGDGDAVGHAYGIRRGRFQKEAMVP